MVKGTANSRAVGVIGGFSVCIIHKEAFNITRKAAVGEHIVSSVIDTAVEVLAAENVCKFMIFAVVGDIYTRTAVCNMAVRRYKSCGVRGSPLHL